MHLTASHDIDFALQGLPADRALRIQYGIHVFEALLLVIEAGCIAIYRFLDFLQLFEIIFSEGSCCWAHIRYIDAEVKILKKHCYSIKNVAFACFMASFATLSWGYGWYMLSPYCYNIYCWKTRGSIIYCYGIFRVSGDGECPGDDPGYVEPAAKPFSSRILPFPRRNFFRFFGMFYNRFITKDLFYFIFY